MKRFYQDFTKRILVTSLISFFSIFGFSATYYVSNSGSDSNSGTSATTPWATLVKVNSVSFLPGDIVLFKMGDTFSGQLLPKTGAIAYGSYGTGAKPIISGFQTLSGWTNRGGGIYSASTTASNTLNLVTLDGTIQRKGRYPNNDFLRFESHSGLTTISDNQLTESPNWTGSEVVIKTSRYSLENKIVLTHTGGTLTFASVGHELQDGYGYFFQNSLQTLDSYGEWFVSNGTFYMYFGSVDPNSKIIRVSIVDDLIKIQNKTDVTLNGLSLNGANSSLVYSNINCTNLKIVDCELKYSGNYGINSTPAGLVVDGCSISEVTNFGIYSYSANALIKNNIIQNIGIWEGMGQYLGYMGLAANGENSITEFNQIRNVGYNGIILRGNNSIVRYNYIDTFCSLLDDGGGIYTSNNTYTGRIIDHNICINGIGNFEGATNYSNTLPSTTRYAHGIYLDERAANITVSNNVTAYNSESGIFLHSAKDIDVTGNTSFNNAKYQLLFSHNTLADNMVDINVMNNLFIAREGVEKCFYFTSNYNDLNFGSASGNVYARPVDDTKTFSIDTYNTSATTYDLAGWKTLSGYDANSAKSSLVVSNSSEIILEYNASTTAKSVSIASPMIDVKGTKYSNSLTLQPFSSVVLIKDASPVFAPGAPTSVVATAGNATATVAFVAPASNGGSAITGYTVTSIPAGGTDIHAGSTSLNHTITGLTSGTSYTFTVKATNSVGTSVASSVSNSVIPTAPAATAYTFTGPTSGNVNTASSSFTVTPNNLYSGTITITPTGPGSAGISAKVLTFSNSSAAQTFTINPTVAGSI
ncbi:MAG: fibronectin type III domain-containing protein, partial [Prolixibacteraceae bacterium]|nr:fibronectin type III domain-containing protein [Prolixibacteraceae bacterium]